MFLIFFQSFGRYSEATRSSFHKSVRTRRHGGDGWVPQRRDTGQDLQEPLHARSHHGIKPRWVGLLHGVFFLCSINLNTDNRKLWYAHSLLTQKWDGSNCHVQSTRGSFQSTGVKRRSSYFYPAGPRIPTPGSSWLAKCPSMVSQIQPFYSHVTILAISIFIRHVDAGCNGKKRGSFSSFLWISNHFIAALFVWSCRAIRRTYFFLPLSLCHDSKIDHALCCF